MLNVPDNTIAYFLDPFIPSDTDISEFITRPDKKREWFDDNFYRCLPLSIANSYGFIIRSPYNFSVVWNGGNHPQDTRLFFDPNNKYNNLIGIDSHFGFGIVTISLGVSLRTPDGVNLMTMAPPNYLLPNITPMVGVIESDNLRFKFTFNLKINKPNIRIDIPYKYPIAAFIPIPRYYQDNFYMKNADDIFEEDIVLDELNAIQDMGLFRLQIDPTLKNGSNRLYLSGKDVYGNEFKDHQRTVDNK